MFRLAYHIIVYYVLISNAGIALLHYPDFTSKNYNHLTKFGSQASNRYNLMTNGSFRTMAHKTEPVLAPNDSWQQIQQIVPLQ